MDSGIKYWKRTRSNSPKPKLKKITRHELSSEEMFEAKAHRIKVNENYELKSLEGYETFRREHNIKKCRRCGIDMKGEPHHFICGKCHGERND